MFNVSLNKKKHRNTITVLCEISSSNFFFLKTLLEDWMASTGRLQEIELTQNLLGVLENNNT